jgi:hypothetical protein
MSSKPSEEVILRPGLWAGLFILLIVITGIVGWLLLGSAVKLTSFYASFLFLWYWSTIDQLDYKKFIPSMTGALLGIALAWGLHGLTAHFGPYGLVIALIAVLGALYLVITERLTTAFNPALTLYLTVIAAPALLGTSHFGELALATLLGGGFFVGFVFLARTLVEKVQTMRSAAKG